jgi:hypothetical protein
MEQVRVRISPIYFVWVVHRDGATGMDDDFMARGFANIGAWISKATVYNLP